MNHSPNGTPGYGFAAFPYTPQANGYFRRLDNGSITKASDLVKGLFHHPQNEYRYKRIKTTPSRNRLQRGRDRPGLSAGQPFPVFPIVGPKKVTDLEESIRAADVTLTPDQLEFLIRSVRLSLLYLDETIPTLVCRLPLESAPFFVLAGYCGSRTLLRCAASEV